MALDLSGRTDDEIQIAYNTLQRNPERFADNQEYKAAIELEYDRRFRRPQSRSPAPNVDANLRASATPVTPDPDLTPKTPQETMRARMLAAGYSPEDAAAAVRQEAGMPFAFQLPDSDEALRRGAARTRASNQRADAFDQSLAQAYGHNDPPPMSTTYVRRDEGSAYAPLTNFQPGATVTIDGLEIPAVDLGDGKLRYRLGDEKRAREAAAEAKWREQQRKSIDEDKERYGWDKPLMLRTEGQIDASLRRRDAERRTRHTPAALQASARQYARTAGVDYETALAWLQADAARLENLQNDIGASQTDDDSKKWAEVEANSIGPARRKLAAMAASRAAKRESENREFLRRRNMLAGGAQNVNSGNVGMWSQLTMLPPEDQIRQLSYALPGGQYVAGVDARQLDQAALLAQRGIQGALAGAGAGPLGQAQADALGLQNDATRAAQRQAIEADLAEQYAASGYFGYDEFTLEEQQNAIDTLMKVHGYTLPEAQAAVDRMAGKRRATQRLPRAGEATPAS